jgi:hypothetical protein
MKKGKKIVLIIIISIVSFALLIFLVTFKFKNPAYESLYKRVYIQGDISGLKTLDFPIHSSSYVENKSDAIQKCVDTLGGIALGGSCLEPPKRLSILDSILPDNRTCTQDFQIICICPFDKNFAGWDIGCV